jgi:hypothetical protein
VIAQLEALLPGERQTLFLRACLLEGEAAREAWAAWLAGTTDPVAAFKDPAQASRRLAPLLDGVATGPRAGTLAVVVSAALMRERPRWEALSAAAGAAVAALDAGGVPHVVVGGVALAPSVYAAPWYRHCHDVDVVLERDLDGRAERLLRDGGFARERTRSSWLHASGTRLVLHTCLRRSRGPSLSFEDLRAHGGEIAVGGSGAAIPAPAHSLVRACEGAFLRSLGWAPDAAFLIGRLGDRGWALALDAAETTRSAAALTVSLRYLRDGIGLPVPAGPLAALADLADRQGAAATTPLLALRRPPQRLTRLLLQLRDAVA